MENEILTSEIKGNRTLATVLFTDCVGFSARMSMNEEHTLDLIRRDLKLMTKVCAAFEGRVLKSTGDGLLVCFSSAVKAVEGAMAIQQKIAEGLQTLPPSDSLLHRIGIHLADMYITPTDVMGNGVNIAARLQTEAEPGGICISQTVYDVAKNALQFDVEYLGPRELKNIREVVPVYKIIVDRNDVSNPYAETVRLLEQSGYGARIRKLIYYVCKNRWETDESKLENLSLKGIIHEFLGLANDYEQVRRLLNTAVGTLSKQDEYTLVANEILKGVAKFYPPEQTLHLWQGQLTTATESMVTGIAAVGTPATSTPVAVAAALDQHVDALRMKKLLYYICRRQWESDTGRLQLANTRQLVTEVQAIAGDRTQLQTLIDRFVQTLNKRVEYTLVATNLLDVLGQLYGEGVTTGKTGAPDTELTMALAPTEQDTPQKTLAPERQSAAIAIAATLDAHPNQGRIKKMLVYLCRGQWVQDPNQLAQFPTASLLDELPQHFRDRAQLQQALVKFVKSLSKQAEYAAIAQWLLQAVRPLYPTKPGDQEPPTAESTTPPENLTALGSATVPPPPAAIPVPNLPTAHVTISHALPGAAVPTTTGRTTLNLFDIRLGILKYTNPLKAKILAFSALHSDFCFTRQDWFNLKSHDLDTLLRGLIQSCRNYTDLEYLLYSTAKRLEQPDDLIQTAETIIKYLRSYYLDGNPSIMASLSSGDETRIGVDEFEVATQEISPFSEEDQTRALPAALPNAHPIGISSPDSDLHTRLLFATDEP